MAHRGNSDFKFNEECRAAINLEEQCSFDQFMDDDSDDFIIFTKNRNQEVTMKKLQRCRVCLKIPASNCLCKQKAASLRSNMSGVTQMSFYSDASYGTGRHQVSKY